jgi:GNAT superfamily N-acetyltransferase
MIRLAKPEDIHDLINLGVAALKESNHPAKLDRKKTKQMLFNTMLLQRKCKTVRIWVSEFEGKIVGLLIGQIDSLFFAKEKFATDLVFYVYPEYRGHGILLIKRFIKWANNDPKVVDITLQQSSGIDINRTAKLYTKLGFKQVGGCFVNYRGQHEQSSQKSS